MPGAEEKPHFERSSFRIGTKIFATMTKDGAEAMVPVRPLIRCFELLGSQPEVFFSYGGWTQRHGSLGVRLSKADPQQLTALVREAWERLAPKPRARSDSRSARAKPQAAPKRH
jgi:hypothetical protein